MKSVIIALLFICSYASAQDEQRKTVIIVAKAANVTAVNQWLRNNIGATGDNVGIPLIGINDPDNASPTHYGTNWRCVTIQHKNEMVVGIVSSPFVHLFSEGSFDQHIEDLGLRKVPTPIY